MLPDKRVQRRDLAAHQALLEGIFNMSDYQLETEIHILLVELVTL